jgi:hypothetical protein
MTLTELVEPTLQADALIASSSTEGDSTVDTGSIRDVARAAAALGDRGRELTLRSPSRIAVRMLTLLELSHLTEPAKATAP